MRFRRESERRALGPFTLMRGSEPIIFRCL